MVGLIKAPLKKEIISPQYGGEEGFLEGYDCNMEFTIGKWKKNAAGTNSLSA